MAQAETSHRDWIWGATAVLVTIIAFVSWSGLFILAAVFYAVGVSRAPWFASKPKETQARRKKSIVVAIVVGLFLFWFLVPQPDVVKIISEAIHPVPSPTPTPALVAVASPVPIVPYPRWPKRSGPIRAASPAAQASPVPLRNGLGQEPRIDFPNLSTPDLSPGSPFAGLQDSGLLRCGVMNLPHDLSKSSLLTMESLYISGAMITVRNIQTDREYSGTTDIIGHSSLIVPYGSYQLTVTAPGYRQVNTLQTVEVKQSGLNSATLYMSKVETATATPK